MCHRDHTPSVDHTCRGLRPTWVAHATDFGHLQPVHDFLMNSASPLVTMVIFSSPSLFFSSSSPKSNSSFVVDFSFLPHHRLIGLFTFRLNMYSAQAVSVTRLNTTQFISGFCPVGFYRSRLWRHLLLHHNRHVNHSIRELHS